MSPENERSRHADGWRFPLDTGITGGVTMFAGGGLLPPANLRARASETKTPTRASGTEGLVKDNKTRAVTIVAALALALLAGGSWVGAATMGLGQETAAVSWQARDRDGDATTALQDARLVRSYPTVSPGRRGGTGEDRPSNSQEGHP